MPSPISTPQNICILRLSAIGDTCHVVPVLRTLQQAWPASRFTWIIGSLESRLMKSLPDVEFITVDKRASRAARGALARTLGSRRFDVLLHMQLALRASLIARQIRATIKLGFDRPRARELQWLFTNQRIAARSREHVLDSFFVSRRIGRRGTRAALGRAAAGGRLDPGRAAHRDRPTHAHHQPVLEPRTAQLERRTLMRQ